MRMNGWIHAIWSTYTSPPPFQTKDPGSHYIGGWVYKGRSCVQNLSCSSTSFNTCVFIYRIETQNILHGSYSTHMPNFKSIPTIAKTTQYYFWPITTKWRRNKCNHFEVKHSTKRGISRTNAYRRDNAVNRSAVQLQWSGSARSMLFTLATTTSRCLLLLCGAGHTS
jgi:hypothetical protein